MLDSETKKNIDEARNILVGKLPNPISQVEQITIALIYKFMSDMDREAVDVFKGKPKFFTGKFKEYDWQNLFAPKLGGHEILKLYADGIEKMNINPNIPPLFREVFKNAYLPYRDPETLKMFLKTINKFSYDHSERLGDTYEYLLSVLGMQGDAGQFRTQRHIIDFMVKCIEPTKHDTICDPACGTAGFVISSYKYIRDSNTDEKGKLKLTPDERKRLSNSLYGYDIDPTMVRFALVNMYLHGFISPHIYEYDTLTSEERWDERFDVILANPPFMSPSGGIRPHKRFSIQASKSEVLFTDYIHEHINQNGRGGIIVPNGIVATTQTAYKQLRETLVKESLIAVVSLPAGVFNPYSGVKTSILLLDKKLAKQTNKILFVKIENDGYDLGAQRREIDKNDLPDAITIVKAFKQVLKKEITENRLTKLMEKLKLGVLVEREKILANKDVVLSAERYIETVYENQYNYEIVKIDDVCDLIDYRGKTPTKTEKGIRLITARNVKKGALELEPEEFADPKLYDEFMTRGIPQNGDVLFTTEAPLGNVAILDVKEKVMIAQRIITLRPKNNSSLDSFYLKNIFLHDNVQKQLLNYATGSTVLGIKQSNLREIKIPLPSIEVQRAIVAEIESYQKIIDGARQVVENYKPRISVNPKWEMVELGTVAEFKNGLNFNSGKGGKSIKVIGVSHFKKNTIINAQQVEEMIIDAKITEEYLLKENDLLFVRSNGNKDLVGRTVLIQNVTDKISFSGFTIRLRFISEDFNPMFYCILFKTEFFRTLLIAGGDGANISNISQEKLRQIQIPLVPKKDQIKILELLNQEQSIIDANKTLIELFEGKIKSKISEVWGE